MYWVRRYVLFHNKRHPSELWKRDLRRSLNRLVNRHMVSSSTQSQALNALVSMHRQVRQSELGWLDALRRLPRKTRLPVVLTSREVRLVLEQMAETPRLMAELLYGAGLRVSECASLRVKDLGIDAGTILVRSARANKGCIVVLSVSYKPAIERQLLVVTQ